jgi:predicted RNase H-like HicB family nuclease
LRERKVARYIAVVDGEPEAFGVAFPDCPGCTAMGATVEEALASAGEALSEWMGDRIAAGARPPAPRTAGEIRSDPAWAADLEMGVLATVPLLLDEGRTVRANLSLDAGLLARIDEAARERGLTRSAFLASAAREKIMAQR